MAVKILSVDDEVDLGLLLTQFFRRKIRKGEYEFLFAHNGLEALQMLLKHPDIDIILSDINMPEMDGLTLLAKINEMRNPAQKCIMVSAYGDMDNIRRAMNSGAFDFATKPIDLEDLERTIEKAIEQINFVKAAQKDKQELRDIQADLSVAREIQLAILPRTFELNMPEADKVDIFASMHAAKDVGGDFYDFFRIDDEKFGFTIADVSGKGVPAAIFMAVSRTLIKATGLRGLSASESMEIVNDVLSGESVDSMFVTVFYGIFNIKTGEINYCNCGHNSPYILHENGSVETLKSHINIVLGAFEGMKFQNDKMILEKGDSLVLYTDGVTEAENLNQEQFGEAKLEQVIGGLQGSSSENIVNAINTEVHTFAGEAPQSDDITVLVIKNK